MFKSKFRTLGGIVLGLALLLTIASTSVFAATSALRVRGSTTLFPILQAAESQFEENSAHALGSGNSADLQIETPAQGSSVGITSVCDGSAEIGMASRKIRSTDCTTTQWGIDDLQETVIARDAVSIIVPVGRTPVHNGTQNCISSANIERIWETPALNITWAELGDAGGGNVIPRNRETTSGTRDAFTTIFSVSTSTEVQLQTALEVLNPLYIRLLGNPDVVTAIAGSTGMMGYVGLGFIDDSPSIKAVSIDFGSGCVAPSDLAILNGTYGAVRDLNLYTLKTTATPAPAYSPLMWDAIEYALGWFTGAFGQRFVADEDFFMAQRPAFDMNNNKQVEVGDVVVMGKFYLKRWAWWPY